MPIPFQIRYISMFFVAGFAFVVALILGLRARSYQVVDHYRTVG